MTIGVEEKSMTFNSVVGRPKSRGILSMDTDKYKAGIRDDRLLALIDYKILTHPDDVEVMLEGIVDRISTVRVVTSKSF